MLRNMAFHCQATWNPIHHVSFVGKVMPRRAKDEREAKRLAKQLGMRVRQLRAAKLWTQAGASEKVGMSGEAYGRIERGLALPSYVTLLRLCVVLETTPDALLGSKQRVPRRGGKAEDPMALAQQLQALDSDDLRAVSHLIKKLSRRPRL